MTSVPGHFKIQIQGEAAPGAIVYAERVRFTLLTSRMLRIEYDPDESFDSRASQAFWFRKQPVPKFEVTRTDKNLEIITEHLHLRYSPSFAGEAFNPENLSIVIQELGNVWQYGMEDTRNLKGTLRTLDMVNGYAPLEPGLVSRDGWTIIDDTDSLVFNQDGWLEARNKQVDYKDLMFFGYGSSYSDCIKDYYLVSGPPALVPRWVLGNWWSRYWAYSQDEIQDLIISFKENEVPLSVCIIDMDWHITHTGNESSGWTGYTWNKDLFPDPKGTLDFMHRMGLRSGLNLHPASGIYPHEEQYPSMAQAMGIDPETKKPVVFDLENIDFAVPYFQYLHHPQEEEVGVDFWWMDWQQGNPSRLPKLNLLWWINHLHFYDLGRKPEKRPFIFSRWGGFGNQRYPIGFSGDTVISWASLAFQPYLTSTAANVGFGWWSHDIGGHMSGITDSELYTRWVQLGVFSPIFRLHSTKDPFLERRPWGYDAETFSVTRKFMQLRHALIPYLYSMAWRDHHHGIPLTRPMYHAWPDIEQAYVCSNQYEFGSELLVAPYITPVDPETRLSRQCIWLPEGLWFDFFSGKCIQVTKPSGEWFGIYGDLAEIPVFAKAGAIVPLGPMVDWNGIQNPEMLIINVFPGDLNHFELFEDDGISQDYLSDGYAITRFSQTWESEGNRSTLSFNVEPAHGDVSVIPFQRIFEIKVHAISKPYSVIVKINNEIQNPVDYQYDSKSNQLKLSKLRLNPTDSLKVEISGITIITDQYTPHQFDHLISKFKLGNMAKNSLMANKDLLISNPKSLTAYQLTLTRSQMRALIEVLYGAGFEHLKNTGEEIVIMWNNRQIPDFSYIVASERFGWGNPSERYQCDTGLTPPFHVIYPVHEFNFSRWNREFQLPGLIQLDFSNLLKAVITFNKNELYPFPKEGLF